MRWLGIIMAAFGFMAAALNLIVGGGQAVLPLAVWGAVGIVGVIIVAKPAGEKKEGK